VCKTKLTLKFGLSCFSDENVMARPLQLNHGICTKGKKSKPSFHDENNGLTHVD
jgi:hypothetical protein